MTVPVVPQSGEEAGTIGLDNCSVSIVAEAQYNKKFCFELQSPLEATSYLIVAENGKAPTYSYHRLPAFLLDNCIDLFSCMYICIYATQKKKKKSSKNVTLYNTVLQQSKCMNG